MDLRTAPAATGGVGRTVGENVERFALETGIPCHFEGHRGAAAVLPPASEVQLIRIVQEGLANVKKHARGAQVWLSVEAGHRWVRVVLRDDGPGFDPAVAAAGGRFGLQTMKERAEGIGGTLELESRPGAGTRLEITAPAGGGRGALGLKTMKEGAEGIGGTLELESRPGAGTRLEITAPAEESRAA